MGVMDEVGAHWARVEALAYELFAHRWLRGKTATAVIEGAHLHGPAGRHLHHKMEARRESG
jgi:hypothetical protein